MTDTNANAPENEPLVISRDETASAEVDDALRERAAVAGTKSHYDSANIRGRVTPKKESLARKALVYLSVAGLLGGLLGWAIGIPADTLRGDPEANAARLLASRADTIRKVESGSLAEANAAPAIAELDRAGANNDFYLLERGEGRFARLDADARAEAGASLRAREDRKRMITDIVLFAIAGACIAAALSGAEPLVSGNRNMAIVNAIVGATLGAAGGVAAGFLAELIRGGLIGGEAILPSDRLYVLVQVLIWATLGLFLAAAPGLVMRSPRRLLIGVVGGLLGGIVGGFFYGPIFEASESELVSRLVALLAIGATAGLATALVEDVVKDGWLKVLAGPIAGKQFVLYRDPTYIGSAPNSHIYLFNDAAVGRRHAAIHRAPNGYEIEDLPLGSATKVNGRVVDRARLFRGDEIEVGTTKFSFGEKPKG